MLVGGRIGNPRDRTGLPVHSHVAALRAYWEGLREDRELPARDRIDPRGLLSALSHVFLIERQAAGLVRFRLAGRALCDVTGQELRGAPVEMAFETDSRPRLAAQLESVFTGPAALDATLVAESGFLRPKLEARMVVLPLVGMDGKTTLAIGCIDMAEDLGMPPRRFTLERVLREPLLVSEVPSEPPPERGKPNLRLVHSVG